jgi:phosphoribosylformylglycinamidine synthase
VPSGFARAGDVVMLLGETADELGGSEWAWVVHGHLGGRPPQPRLAAERQLSEALQAAAGERLLSCAHDVSDGGLGQTLVEAALMNGIGATVTLDGDAFVALFSESAARAVVTCSDADVDRLLEIAAEHDLAVTRLGRTGGDTLDVTGEFALPLDRLRETHEATLPRHLS